MTKGLFRTILTISAGLMLLGSDAQTHQLCEGFAPENDLKIPVGVVHRWALAERFAGGGLTEQQFNDVIERFERLYRDDFAKAGGQLRVNRRWTDSTVNANAIQYGSSWQVNMYGGLARHPATTVEGFALVLCHEGGHHIGGAPKKAGFGSSWATNEGGADYFATLKCLRRFFAEDDNESIIAQAQIDPLAKEHCEKEFTARKDQLICMRSSLANMSASLVLMDIRHENTPPSFGTPDPKVVSQMIDGHPATQCRMDTYFNGATCHVDASVPVSNSDYREGSCAQPQDNAGFRPRCWFKD